MPETIHTVKSGGGVTLNLVALDIDDGADYRLRLDRPGLAAISVALSNTQFDELVSARDAHRDAT